MCNEGAVSTTPVGLAVGRDGRSQMMFLEDLLLLECMPLTRWWEEGVTTKTQSNLKRIGCITIRSCSVVPGE